MEVSRSGYYAFLKRPESKRTKRQKYILEKIRIIHKEKHEIYGSPNITVELNNSGISVSRGMVSRLMRQNGIKSRVKRKYKATTDSNHNLPVAENILNREFTAASRDQKWLSDITYSVPGVQVEHGCSKQEPRAYLKYINIAGGNDKFMSIPGYAGI